MVGEYFLMLSCHRNIAMRCFSKGSNCRTLLFILTLNCLCLTFYLSHLTDVSTLWINVKIYNESENKAIIASNVTTGLNEAHYWKGFLTINCDKYGRLGNKMSQYATLIANARYYNYRPVMNEHMGKKLRDEVFPYLSIPTKKEDELFDEGAEIEYMTLGKFENETNFRNSSSSTIFITGYPSDLKKFQYVFDDLRNEFKFAPKYQEKAEEFVEQVKKHYLLSRGLRNEVQITLVGVHARRKDYSNYLKLQNGVLVTKNFFRVAMEKMKEILNYPENILFIMSSDDLYWCKKHFSDNPNIYFTNKHKSHPPALDMAILSSCHHSIITYGTFGLWSAILAGGEVILADGFSENKYTAISNWPKSWVTVHDPCIRNATYICK